MATIITKNSSTASSVPTAAQLVKGELAVNVTDKRLFTEDNSGNIVELGTNPSSLALSSGSVNGVAYLNGSKVLTTGTGLQFDGSNLGLGVTPGAWTTYRVMDIGGGQSVFSYQDAATNTIGFAANALWNGSWVYRQSSVGASRYALVNNAHQWYTAPSGTAGNAISFTQAMTLDASGTLGIGVTSPAWKLDIDGIIASRSGSLSGLRFQTAANGYNGFVLYETSSNSIIVNNYNAGPITFKTNDTERARITSGGDLLVGTTTAGAGWGAGGKLTVDMGSSYTVLKSTNGAGSPELLCWSATGTSDNLFITFATETGGTTRGTIDYNRAVGLTRYNTTSDYRAKTVKGPVDNPLQRVMQLKPCTGRMNEATEDIDFFVAHELQSIVPSAVSGEKDAVNEDGTPKYQLVDKSALIPLLTAAIQELNAKVESLTAELNTLKGN